jgi:hypothetical protein
MSSPERLLASQEGLFTYGLLVINIFSIKNGPFDPVPSSVKWVSTSSVTSGVQWILFLKMYSQLNVLEWVQMPFFQDESD